MSAGPELQAGRIFVDLVPRLQAGFGNGIEKEMDGPLGRIKSKAAGIGKAVAVGVGVGIVGGGALLLGAAKTLDDAFDTIRIGTGETGKNLEGLKTSFRNVAKTVPNDMGEVASAISDIHKRTGLTGAGLESLARKELTLARVTDKDLGTTIKSTTKVMGAWSIGTDKQGEKLDYLYRVSQKTGIGVDDLSGLMTKFGPTLQSLGFGFDQSAALLGKFEAAGVNTGVVMGAMKKGLGALAKAGEDPATALARVTGEIKGAGSEAEANKIAIGLFGAKAGPEMAKQIREGKFAVGDLVKELQGSKETIEKSASDTDDFAEKFAVLKNRAILAAEPLAGKLFDAINGLADAAAPAADWLGKKIPVALDAVKSALTPVVDGAKQIFGVLLGRDFGGGPLAPDSPLLTGAEKFRGIVIDVAGWLMTQVPAAFQATKDALGPVVSGIADFVKANPGPVLAGLAAVVMAVLVPAFIAWATSALGAAIATIAAALPIILLVAAIALLVGGLVYAYQHFEGFRNVVDSVASFLVDQVVPRIVDFSKLVAAKFLELVGWVRDHWGEIKAVISGAVDGVKAVVMVGVGIVQKLWDTFGSTLVNLAKAYWGYVVGTVQNGINLVRGVIQVVTSLIHGDWSGVWDGLKAIAGAAWDQLLNIAKFGIAAVKAAIGLVLGAMKLEWETAWGAMKSFVGSLWHGLGDGLKGVLNGMLRGIESAINAAIDLLNGALDAIDKAAGPYVNFGEIPHVHLPQLARGGTAKTAGLSIVGDGGNGSGAEVLALPRGASVLPLDVVRMVAEAALLGATGTDGAGVVFEDGAVQVDARGMYSPELVGDYASRIIAHRVTARRARVKS